MEIGHLVDASPARPLTDDHHVVSSPMETELSNFSAEVKYWLGDDEKFSSESRCLFDDTLLSKDEEMYQKISAAGGLFASSSSSSYSTYFEGDNERIMNTSTLREVADAVGLPSCLRLNEILSERGYSPMQLSYHDVDVTKRSVSSDIMNAWAESLLQCIHELLVRLDTTTRTVQDISQSVRKGGLSQDAMQSRITTLQAQLKEAQRKAANVELNNTVLEEERITRSNEKKHAGSDAARHTRAYEQKILALQTQLSQLQKDAVDWKRQKVMLEEEKSALIKQKKISEAETVRLTKIHENKTSTLQMQLTHAQKKVSEHEAHRAALEEEKSGFSEQRRLMDAAVVQLTKAHEQKVGLLQTQLAQASKRLEASEKQRALLEEERAAAREAKAKATSFISVEHHHSNNSSNTTTNSNSSSLYEQRIGTLQEKLAIAVQRAVDAEQALSTLEEERATRAKSKRDREGDVARVTITFEQKVAALQDKLTQAQRKAADADRLRELLEEEKSGWARQKKAVEGDALRLVRALEAQLGETERRSRQREIDLDRLRVKLAQVAIKEKETAARHRKVLAAWRAGAVPSAIAPSLAPSNSSNSNSNSNSNSANCKEINTMDLVEALDHQRECLERRNEELNEQLADLSMTLKSHENNNISYSSSHSPVRGKRQEQTQGVTSPSISFSLVDIAPIKATKALATIGETVGVVHETATASASDGCSLLDVTGMSLAHESSHEESKDGSGSKGMAGNPTADTTTDSSDGDHVLMRQQCDEVITSFNEKGFANATPTARRMFEVLQGQKARIELLESRIARWKDRHTEVEALATQLRAKLHLSKEQNDNLQLELSARPTVKAMRDKERDCRALESRLHDIAVMRKESTELESLRKHMSAKDRMAADRRNYEMGLYLLDSLPQEIAKENLKMVCRELDLSDISDVQPALQKLKAVVEAVPRMERFITDVCGLVKDKQQQRMAAVEASSLRVTTSASGRIKITRFSGSNHNTDTANENSSSSSSSKPVLLLGARGSMEEVVPCLEAWASDLDRLPPLVALEERLRNALQRHETAAGVMDMDDAEKKDEDEDENRPPMPPLALIVRNSTEGATMNSSSSKASSHRSQLSTTGFASHRDLIAAVEALCKYRAHTLVAEKKRVAEEDLLLREHPEEKLVSLVRHMQYLFSIPSLNGLLPRLNQLYLRDQEISNFLSTIRTLFGTPYVRQPGHKSSQSSQPLSSSKRGRSGGGVMVELDQEVNEEIMNDDGIQVLPIPSDSAVLTEITKRLTRYNSALRTCSNKNEDLGEVGEVTDSEQIRIDYLKLY